ncbi:hypothetical protein [Streptomyces tendae]|uniref:hypothetical protein n=1 Tax=Streptomyces tendae TaxID=1932 RepID=UPI003D7131A7
MSFPVAVNTADGACWTLRTVTAGGIGLYAPEAVKTCPEFVMATLEDLAAHGIQGSADALPMPVGPAPQETGPRSFALVGEVTAEDYDDAVYAAEQAYSGMRGQGYKGSISVGTDGGGAEELRAKFEAQMTRAETLDGLLRTAQDRVAELEAEREKLVRWHGEDSKTITRLVARVDRHRARVAELEGARREFPLFYIADYEGAGLTLHLTREAARDVCDDFAKAEARGRGWDWRTEDDAEFQFWTDPDNDRPIGETGGAIWEIQVENSSAPRTYPPALPWAKQMDADDLEEFLADLTAAIVGRDGTAALDEVEKTCGTWRLIAEAQHAHNTAPGPDTQDGGK